LKRKSSAHASATVFQNGGSACTVFAESGWPWIWKAGHCVFHISKSGCVFEVVAVESRTAATSSVVVIGGGVVDVVVITIGDSRGVVGVGAYNGIPGSTILWSVNGPVGSRGRSSRHGTDANGGWQTRRFDAHLYVYLPIGVQTFELLDGFFCSLCIVPIDPLVIGVWVTFPGN
jgi:hypothetical protein